MQSYKTNRKKFLKKSEAAKTLFKNFMVNYDKQIYKKQNKTIITDLEYRGTSNFSTKKTNYCLSTYKSPFEYNDKINEMAVNLPLIFTKENPVIIKTPTFQLKKFDHRTRSKNTIIIGTKQNNKLNKFNFVRKIVSLYILQNLNELSYKETKCHFRSICGAGKRGMETFDKEGALNYLQKVYW